MLVRTSLQLASQITLWNLFSTANLQPSRATKHSAMRVDSAVVIQDFPAKKDPWRWWIRILIPALLKDNSHDAFTFTFTTLGGGGIQFQIGTQFCCWLDTDCGFLSHASKNSLTAADALCIVFIGGKSTFIINSHTSLLLDLPTKESNNIPGSLLLLQRTTSSFGSAHQPITKICNYLSLHPNV